MDARASRTRGSTRRAPRVVPVHTAVAGRARLAIEGLRRDDALRRALERDLAGQRGVRSAGASALTGRILILYEPGLELKEVIRVVERVLDRCLAAYSGAWQVSAPVNAEARMARRKRPQSARGTARPTARWHLLEAEQVAGTFDGSPATGLGATAAAAALRRYGPNSLVSTPPRSDLAIFLSQFKSLPVALLGASAALSLATGGLADAVIILGVVLINAGVGFFTERQAERTIEGLSTTGHRRTLLVRDAQICEAAVEEVVPGDLLTLAPGVYVAADARLVETRALTMDESALTGESLPVSKAAERLTREVPLAERLNMVYRGTVVTGGSGLAIVVATGQWTELGRIQSLVGETRPPETPMQRQLDRLGRQMVWASLAICGLVGVVGVLRGLGLLPMLRASVSLAVAAVPEGLPMVATTTLALGIRRMREQNVLIRQLGAVETLGSVQVICLDKTGTLTENRMSVLAVLAGLQRYQMVEGTLRGLGGPADPYRDDDLLRLLHVAVLCNEAEVSRTGKDYVLNGSATETALVSLALALGVSVTALRRCNPVSQVQYRAEGRNYMTTWHPQEKGRFLQAVKGSPAEVLALCNWWMVDGRRVELDDSRRESLLRENEIMAGQALRVLALAYGETDAPRKAGELTWLGLIGMADPVRPGMRELMRLFHQAGIRTAMITGDQSATAYAVGREIALEENSELEILDSTHLEEIEPVVLSAMAQKVHVFARVSPAHKLQIVQALQRAGKVVAMTGDGINDGPALRAADIGVAMGSAGTDVAHSVADVVLEDDNLHTMIVAVSHGRTIYSNIRKSIRYLMATNMSEIAVTLGSLAIGLGQPLNTMQLLWLNLISDVFPALALAVEPPEPDVLRQSPRDPAEPIIRREDFRRFAFEAGTLSAGTLAAYGYGVARYGQGPQASTLAFTTLTLQQLLHAYSCRSPRHGLFSAGELPPNRHLDAAIGGSVALQLLTLWLPPLRSLLGAVPLSPLDMTVMAMMSAPPLLLNDFTKRVGATDRDLTGG